MEREPGRDALDITFSVFPLAGLGSQEVAYLFPDVYKRQIPYTPPAYHLLGFDAALELPVKRGHQVRFMLSADNLLNREYKEYTNRSRYYAHDMGRDVRCGVNWIF